MANVRVMFAGDSLTLGSTPYQGSYRRPLNNLAPNLCPVGSQLDSGGNSGYSAHEGYGGGQVATRQSDILTAIDTYTPDVVLIWFGTNEVTDGTYTSAQEVVFLYDFAVDCLAKTSVSTVIVGNCAPRRSDDALYADQNTHRSNIATHFTVTQAPLPDGIFYCDAGAGLTDSDFGDALHLNGDGYDKVAAIWYDALKAAGVVTDLANAGKNVGDEV